MAKKVYISEKMIHIGSLKMTIKPGTEITYIKTGKSEKIEIAGEKFNVSNDFKICLDRGFFREKKEGETVKVEEPKTVKKEEVKKMAVIPSDEDQMMKEIEITPSKKLEKKVEVEEDKDVKTVRGMKVIKDDSIGINEVSINKDKKPEVKKPVLSEEEKAKKAEEVKKRTAARKRESEKNQKAMKK